MRAGKRPDKLLHNNERATTALRVEKGSSKVKLRYEEVGTVTLSGRKIAAGVVAATTVVALGYAAWEINWTRQAVNADRRSVISRQNLGFQQAKVDDLARKMSDISNLAALAESGSLDDQGLAANKAQQAAIKGQVCADYRQLTDAVKGTLDTDLAGSLQILCHVIEP